MPSAGTALCSVVCALPHSAISALKGNGNWIWERSGTELEVDFICPQTLVLLCLPHVALEMK